MGMMCDKGSHLIWSKDFWVTRYNLLKMNKMSLNNPANVSTATAHLHCVHSKFTQTWSLSLFTICTFKHWWAVQAWPLITDDCVHQCCLVFGNSSILAIFTEQREQLQHLCDQATIKTTHNRSPGEIDVIVWLASATACWGYQRNENRAQVRFTSEEVVRYHHRGKNTGNPQDQTKPLGKMRQTPTAMEVYDLMEEIL